MRSLNYQEKVSSYYQEKCQVRVGGHELLRLGCRFFTVTKFGYGGWVVTK